MQTVKVLGKITLSGGRVVKRTGCALPKRASALAVRLLNSDTIRNNGSTMALAFRSAMSGKR